MILEASPTNQIRLRWYFIYFYKKKTVKKTIKFQCFLRCYLGKVGILTDEGSVDSKQAVDMLWTTSGDAIDDCVKEVSVNDEKGEGNLI